MACLLVGVGVSAPAVAAADTSTTFGSVAELSLAAVADGPSNVTATLLRTVQTSALDPPSPDPSGVTYMPPSGRLFVSDSEVEEMSIFQDANAFTVSRSGSLLATASTLRFSREPTGVSYDTRNGHLFVSDDSQRKIFDLAPGADAELGTADDTWTSFSVTAFGGGDPEDVTINTRSGDVYIIDGVGTQVFSVSPGHNGLFDGVAPKGDDTADHFDVGQYGAGDPEGIAYSADRDTLFVVDSVSHAVYELTTGGSLVNKIDISAADGMAEAGITVAPPSVGGGGFSLYVVDRRVDNDAHPNENDGEMYELAPNVPVDGNAPPRVSAGADQVLVSAKTAKLAGTVTDDGQPDPPGALSTTWSMERGPGTVTFGNRSSRSTTASFSAPGTYLLRLTVDDGNLSSVDDVSVEIIDSSKNLVTNPGFETTVKGWNGTGVTRVSGSYTGSFAGKVANTTTGKITCTLNDSPNWVATTVAGNYTGSLWVRSDTAGASLRLRFREYDKATDANLGSAESLVALTTDWQQVHVDYTPTKPGGSTLDFNAYRSSAPPGTCFYADDAIITLSNRAPDASRLTVDAAPTFPDTVVGETSPARSVTLTNTGTAPLALGTPTVTAPGNAPGDYTAVRRCATLDPGASCSVDVTFRPSATGSRTGTLSVPSNDAAGPGAVPLTATGLAEPAPRASLDPARLDFGDEVVGSTSAPQLVSLTNTGSAPLEVGDVTVDTPGNDVDEFALTGTDCTTIAPGKSCAIAVTFMPAATGTRTASLVVASDDPAGPATSTLAGNGVPAPAPRASLSPATVAFPHRLVGDSSAAQAVTLTNAGTAPLRLDAVTVASPGNAVDDFVVLSRSCPPALDAGFSCTLALTFTPSEPGARTATLSITSDDPGGEVTAPLTGTGDTEPTPAAAVSASQTDFGDHVVGTTTTRTVTVTNTGTATLTLGTPEISGPATADFALFHGCTTIEVGASCHVGIGFTPGATGARMATLTVPSDDPGSPVTVALTGNGVPVPAPHAAVDPAALTFGDQAVGTTSGARQVTLTNTGTAPLHVGSPTTAGPDAGDFGASTDAACATVAVGASCTVYVSFAPSATGSRTATLTVPSDDPSGPAEVSLDGTGVPTAPAATLSGTSLDFGDQLVGSTSAGRSITVTNTGTAELDVGSPTVEGPEATDFAASSDCDVVAVGESCTVMVTLRPGAIGTRRGTLTVPSDDPAGPSTVALSGTGTAPQLSVTPPALTFAGQFGNTTSPAQSVTVANTGSAPLHVGTPTITGTAAGDFSALSGCSEPVTPGGTCTVSVAFTPSEVGTRTAQLHLPSDDPASPASVALSGTGKNLVGNSQFETDVKGWNVPAGTSLTQAAPGHGGGLAAKVSNTTTAKTTCTLNDSPNWVATTAGTGKYTGSLWVRSDTAGATLRLRFREYDKVTSALLGTADSTVTLTTGWQQVRVTYTPASPGRSTLDLNAYASCSPGTCFYADDAAVFLSS